MLPDQPIYMRHRKGVKLHIVESSQARTDVERIVRDFAPTAFRRPVADDELQPFVDLALGRLVWMPDDRSNRRFGRESSLCFVRRSFYC